MVGVRLEGRLGNQLFQYAFVYATARKLKTRFFIDRSVDFFLLPRYFDNTKDNFTLLDRYIFNIRGFKNIFTYHLRKLFYKRIQKIVATNHLELISENAPGTYLEQLKNHTFYTGFFQSEIYFKEFKSDLLQVFEIKYKYINAFYKLVAQLSLPVDYVVMHIRRADYLDHHYTLDVNYYHKAIEYVSTDNYYVIVSDDPEFAKNEFSYLKNVYFSENSEIIDFQFISNASTCILSNSSFSWWGAYLNRLNPKVIVPRYWLGSDKKVEFPAGIILSNWIRLD